MMGYTIVVTVLMHFYYARARWGAKLLGVTEVSTCSSGWRWWWVSEPSRCKPSEPS